jgi:hypothetical protein
MPALAHQASGELPDLTPFPLEFLVLSVFTQSESILVDVLSRSETGRMVEMKPVDPNRQRRVTKVISGYRQLSVYRVDSPDKS